MLLAATTVREAAGVNANVYQEDIIVEMLRELAKRADHFEKSLPDFIVTETLTQELINKKDKIKQSRVTVSLLTGRQIRTIAKDGRVELRFKEVRQVQTINDKESKSQDFKVTGTQVKGAFSSVLLSHFTSTDQRDYLFELEPDQVLINHRSAYLLNFSSRGDRNNQFYIFDGIRTRSHQKGRAWIDIETMVPLRIEFNEINLPKDIEWMFYAVDYAPVELGGVLHTLPVSAETEIIEKGQKSRAHHHYSNYRKFSTDVTIE